MYSLEDPQFERREYSTWAPFLQLSVLSIERAYLQKLMIYIF